jgi:hypothetical protein
VIREVSKTQCDVCLTELTAQKQFHKPLNEHSDHGGIVISCPQCGDFYITFKALDLLNEEAVKYHVASYYIRKEYDVRGESGQFIPIDSTFIQKCANLPEIGLEKKIDLLLQAFFANCVEYGDILPLQNNLQRYIALACLQSKKSLYFTLDALEQKALVVLEKYSFISGTDYISVALTPKGFSYVETLKKQTDSTQIFIAMWFNSLMDKALNEAIRPAITDAGLNPFRIDDKDHNNNIDDEIIAEIQRSRAVVADFTKHRGGVYFEAGYALGLGLPVIWTCREDEKDKLHFDIRQYNTIMWEDSEEGRTKFREALKQRIRSTIHPQN